MLIKCPECGKEISDKAASCPNCGCPASEWMLGKENEEADNAVTEDDDFVLHGDYEDYDPVLLQIFKDSAKKKEAYIPKTVKETASERQERLKLHCPKCGSDNISVTVNEYYEPPKTKASYSLNLNPFKPFTLYNKKEKVVESGHLHTEKSISVIIVGMYFIQNGLNNGGFAGYA